MGANAVRLIRTEHRRMLKLAARLTGRYRAGAALPAELAELLERHAHATAGCVVPFAEDRVPHLDKAYLATVDHLAVVAGDLLASPHPVPAPLVDAVRAAIDQHIAIEEDAVLRVLDERVSVERLRHLGEAFRRTRDRALKTTRRPTRRPGRAAIPSRAELYERARYRNIAGRSSMSRSELMEALEEQR